MSTDITSLVVSAIQEFGSEQRAADAFGVSQPVVNLAKKTGKVGPKLAMGIDRATRGRISKSVLRPDLWEAPTHAHGSEK
jgi:DNA-binding transcriptional regulator YdaS (Cro superfamily)